MKVVFLLAELASALGRHVELLRESEQLRDEAYQSAREEDGEFFSAHYTFCDGVLEVSCDRQWNVRAIFLDPERSKAFDVVVTEVPAILSRTDAHTKFGRPESSGDGMVDAILGDIPSWDRFELPREKCLLHLSYTHDEAAVSKITIMPLDWQPGGAE